MTRPSRHTFPFHFIFNFASGDQLFPRVQAAFPQRNCSQRALPQQHSTSASRPPQVILLKKKSHNRIEIN